MMTGRAFVSAIVLYAIVSPVFAVGPTLSVTNGGLEANGKLNEAGNWVWKVLILPDFSLNTSGADPGTPLAASLGFRAIGSDLIRAWIANSSIFNTEIPSGSIFGWENPGIASNGFPKGLQSNCAGGGCTESTPGDDPNTVFAALGSRNTVPADVVGGAGGGVPFIAIEVQGPAMGRLSMSIEWGGSHNGKGRISQISSWNGSTYGTTNFDAYAGSVTQTALPGDANLDGLVDATDYNIWLSHAGGSSKHWYDGDFNDDDKIDSLDLNILLGAASVPGDYDFNGEVNAADYVVWRKGPSTIYLPNDYSVWRSHFGNSAGSGSASALSQTAVPEPSALVLLLAAFVVVALRRPQC